MRKQTPADLCELRSAERIGCGHLRPMRLVLHSERDGVTGGISLLQQSHSDLHDFEQGRNAYNGRYDQNGDDDS